MEWRIIAPVVLAIVMFLLVGTICERRIEATIRRLLEHRRALFPITPPPPEYEDASCSTTDLIQDSTPPPVRTPPTKTLGDCRRRDSAMITDDLIRVIQMRDSVKKLVEDVAC